MIQQPQERISSRVLSGRYVFVHDYRQAGYGPPQESSLYYCGVNKPFGSERIGTVHTMRCSELHIMFVLNDFVPCCFKIISGLQTKHVNMCDLEYIRTNSTQCINIIFSSGF
jgi:hypothetical protein